MTGLFFAVDPVWWIGGLHLTSVLIALSVGGLIWMYLWHQDRPRSMSLVQKGGPYQYHPVDPNRDDYPELTLIEIRRYLTATHQPEHSWAHIPDRIASYTEDPRLIGIITVIERAEYSKNKLTLQEKEDMNRELSMRLKH